MFAGDLLFLQHVPVVDASVLGWLKDIPRLAAIPARLGVPAHGPVGVAWPQALDAEKAYLQKLTEDVRAIPAKGEDINIAARNAGQSEASKWHLSASITRAMQRRSMPSWNGSKGRLFRAAGRI